MRFASPPVGAREPESPLKLAVVWIGIVLVLVGVLGTVGWISGWRILPSFSANYVPMAWDTALIFVMCGGILLINSVRPLHRRGRAVAAALVALCSIYGLLKFAEYFFGVELTFENTLFPVGESVGSFPVNRMSPITGALFFLSGIGLMRTLVGRATGWSWALVDCSGVLTVAAGLTLTTGYLFGAPLLYGFGTIPVAAVTSGLFLLLGAGLLLSTGSRSIVVRQFTGPSVRARMMRMFVPLVVTSLLATNLMVKVLNGSSITTFALGALVFTAITVAVVFFLARTISGSIAIADGKREQAENDLRGSEERLATIFYASPAAISVTRVADNRLLDVNTAWEKLNGYQREDALGNTFQELNLWADPGEREHLVNTIQEVGVALAEVQIRPRSGKIRDVLMSGQFIQISGQSCLLTLATDITENNRTQKENMLEATRRRNLLDLHRMADGTEKQILEFTLEIITTSMQSQIAYVGTIDPEEAGLTIHAWSKGALEECAVNEQPKHFLVSECGLWGEVIRQRRPIIVNDYDASREHKKGYPMGHVPIRQFLSVPAFSSGKIVAVAAVANRESVYEESDVTALTMLLQESWSLIERKRAAERLVAAEVRYRRLFEAARDGVLIVDAGTGLIVDVNPFLVELLGLSYNDFVGKALWELGAFGDIVANKDNFAELLKKRYVQYDNLPLRTAGGIVAEVEFVSNVYQADGVDVIQCNIRDVSERKELEKLRRINVEILQILSLPGELKDSISEVITVLKARTGFDAVGICLKLGDDFPYFCQQGFTENFLLTENTLAERSAVGGLCRNKDGSVRLECTCGLVVSGKTDPTNALFTKGGSAWTHDSLRMLDIPPDEDLRSHPRNQCIHKSYSSIALVPIRDSDGIIGLVQFNDQRKGCFTLAGIEVLEGIAFNIGTALIRKKVEFENKDLRVKAETSSRLAAVGEMAAGIAHEINNPLTGVIGFSELLMTRDLPAEVKEQLKIINDGSQRVQQIVKRVLTFARQVKPMKTSVNVNELIDATLDLRSYVLKTANIHVAKHLDPSLPCVMADPGQMQQVFLNLIVNAEYAMKEAHGKGILTITTERKDDHIRISVQDDGTGMSPETKAKVFQPFFTTKQVGEGTGLGLSLSRSIILEHAGTIEVESAPGEGTTFIITLAVTPLTEEAIAEAPVVTAAPPAKVRPARILVVDDEDCWCPAIMSP